MLLQAGVLQFCGAGPLLAAGVGCSLRASPGTAEGWAAHWGFSWLRAWAAHCGGPPPGSASVGCSLRGLLLAGCRGGLLTAGASLAATHRLSGLGLQPAASGRLSSRGLETQLLHSTRPSRTRDEHMPLPQQADPLHCQEAPNSGSFAPTG